MTEPTGQTHGSDSMILDDHQKVIIRARLRDESEKLLGIPYRMAQNEEEYNQGIGKWLDLTRPPSDLDCSGLTNGVYRKVGMKLPHGAQAQFDITIAIITPKPGDLAFFGRDGNINKIYHVGMVYDDDFIIEARGLQPGSSFETGKVILRPRAAWERYIPNFVGYRAHQKLA